MDSPKRTFAGAHHLGMDPTLLEVCVPTLDGVRFDLTAVHICFRHDQLASSDPFWAHPVRSSNQHQ